MDGFNLYHAVDDLRDQTLKWLNLRALSEGLLRPGEILATVNYFSAYATWRPSSYAKHRTYTAALRATGVNVVMGNFKKKDRRCLNCGATWVAHEEKETDVHMAVQLVADALRAACARIIVISADSDLVPAIKLAKRLATSPIEVFVAAPPGRYTAARELNPKLEITVGRVRKALLPMEVRDQAGKVVASCPADWR